MAEFGIKTAFKLSTRPGLVLAGNIINGYLNIGDTILFSYEGGDYEKTIFGIEAVDYNIGRPDFYSYAALVVKDELDKFDPEKIIEQNISVFNISKN